MVVVASHVVTWLVRACQCAGTNIDIYTTPPSNPTPPQHPHQTNHIHACNAYTHTYLHVRLALAPDDLEGQNAEGVVDRVEAGYLYLLGRESVVT